MNKKELVSRIGAISGVQAKDVAKVIDALPEVVLEAMRGDVDILIPGVGKIVLKVREAGKARNPKTNEVVDRPRKLSIRIKPASTLVASLND